MYRQAGREKQKRHDLSISIFIDNDDITKQMKEMKPALKGNLAYKYKVFYTLSFHSSTVSTSSSSNFVVDLH